MQIRYLGAIAIASMLTLGTVACGTTTAVDPAGADQEAVNPCAANPCAAAADPCAAANPGAAAGQQPRVYAFEGLAIRGADPVAYFTESQAVRGSADYEYEWNGTIWRFSNAENLALFTANPEAYAPQYGGYCAKAVSEGYLASIDPEAWRVEDGKLYLNYSPEVQQQWLSDVPGNIAKGDQNWDSVLSNSSVPESGKSW